MEIEFCPKCDRETLCLLVHDLEFDIGLLCTECEEMWEAPLHPTVNPDDASSFI